MSRGKFALWIIVLSLLGAAYALVYGRIAKYKIEHLPSKYVYLPYGSVTNPVLYIRSLNFRGQYGNYVDEILKGSLDAKIRVPQEELPGTVKIYITKYLADSALVAFYSPEYHGKGFGFRTGYIHRAFIHDTLKAEDAW